MEGHRASTAASASSSTSVISSSCGAGATNVLRRCGGPVVAQSREQKELMTCSAVGSTFNANDARRDGSPAVAYKRAFRASADVNFGGLSSSDVHT